jgi:hypothetical protein
MDRSIKPPVALDPNLYQDSEQALLAARFRARIQIAYEETPGISRMLLGHAQAVLRQYADELVSVSYWSEES